MTNYCVAEDPCFDSIRWGRDMPPLGCELQSGHVGKHQAGSTRWRTVSGAEAWRWVREATR